MKRVLGRPCRSRTSIVLMLGLVAATWPRGVREAAADPLLLRLFLLDGTWLVSYGEYARVGDRVVVPLPLGLPAEGPPVHVVSVPAAVVDWPRTEQDARRARSAHYAATRGPADFAALETELAELLTAVGRETDQARRLELAERAQQRLSEFAGATYGYRAADLQHMTALVGELVAGLRAASGVSRFDLHLVAEAGRPVAPPLPPPSLQDLIAQVLLAARLTPVPAERLSLLQSARGLLDTRHAALPADWVRETRRAAEGALAAEWRTEHAYRTLTRTALAEATAAAARGEVARVEGVIETVLERDKRLGRRRPDEMAALMATLSGRLIAAQQRRLELDRWRLRLPALRAYFAGARRVADRFRDARPALDEIRRLAGPDVARLARAELSLFEAQARWAHPVPPAEVAPAHDLAGRALTLALEAVRTRRRAIETGDLGAARTAASAAAGSLLLFDRAQADLARALVPPLGK